MDQTSPSEGCTLDKLKIIIPNPTSTDHNHRSSCGKKEKHQHLEMKPKFDVTNIQTNVKFITDRNHNITQPTIKPDQIASNKYNLK